MDAQRNKTTYSIMLFYPSNIFNYRKKLQTGILINLPSTETYSDLLIKNDIYSTHSNFLEDASIILSKTALESYIFHA